MTALPDAPFGIQPLPDYKLDRSPLRHTIVQIRFPRSTELAADRNSILDIARVLAEVYPAFSEGNEAEFEFGPNGPEVRTSPRWQFTSFSETESVVVTPTSVAFETRGYVSRDHMLERLRLVLDATLRFARPAFIERIGVRYSNLLTGPNITDAASNYFKAPLTAGLSLPSAGATARQVISNAVYDVNDNVALSVRSGLVPAGVQIDAVPLASDGDSFILDLDAFQSKKQQEVRPEALLDQVSSLAEVAYRFFLWSLTGAGMEHFGGRKIDE
jgi:uncharacterized protein (TIGR04255 family)